MIFDVDFPEVREIIRSDSQVEAFARSDIQLGCERVVDGVRYKLEMRTISPIPATYVAGTWIFLVTGTFVRSKSKHPRLWGVTHV